MVQITIIPAYMMNEVEFGRLQWIMVAIRGEDFMLPYLDSAGLVFVNAPTKAANDNEPDWPLIPFPAAWNGSC